MGGGSSQPKNTTTTTKTELPPWLANAYQGFFSQTNAVNDKPYQSYGGALNAGLSQGQQDAYYQATEGAAGRQPGMQNQYAYLDALQSGAQNINAQANPYLGATTQVGTNAYAGSNPYLQQMISKANGDITDSYQKAQGNLASQFSTGGAFGGSAMQQAVSDQNKQLADGLSNSENQFRFQDYTTQQGLAENAINRSVQAQQTDLARNSALSQQGFQNQLAAGQFNTGNVLNASQALNGVNALRSQYNGQLAGLGQIQQDYTQGNIDQAYNDWYQQNYGYDQQRLANFGNALNSTSGQFSGSATSGLNPAYKPRTAGGAVAAGAGGAAAGAGLGAAIGGGAASGSAAGPWGAVIGAGVGLASYYL